MYRHLDPNKIHVSDGVGKRAKVSKLVATDIVQAHKVAQSIQHPWYKCQALATVAQNASKTYARAIIIESFESAKNCHDENRRVSVVCWPLKVAIGMEYRDISELIVDYCSEQLTHEVEPIWKWCAVSVVHTIKNDLRLLERFYSTFVSATEKCHGWKIERWLNNMLSDETIKRDQRYIAYVSSRLSAIQQWKRDNKSRGSS